MSTFWDVWNSMGPLAQFITAVVLALNYMQSRRNNQAIQSQAANIEKIEIATNSMKDRLVQVTGEAKYAEGLKHGEDYARRDTIPTAE